MVDIADIATQPITQIGALVGFLALLQKTGFDVKAIIRSGLGIDGATRQMNDSTNNGLQTVLVSLQQDMGLLGNRMGELAQYANHDTTERLDIVTNAVKDLHGKMDEHIRQHDRTNYLLEDIKTNGIKCRT